MKSNEKGFLSGGVLVAISASLCCITPVLGFLDGIRGIAATFSWMEAFRPYLIGLTTLILGFAWYQKLRPRTAEEIACACETDEKPAFTQTKKFLGIVTVFAVSILAFPKYSYIFFPSMTTKEVIIVSPENVSEKIFNVKGMTCSSCEETIKHAINKLPGSIYVSASHKTETVSVKFDKFKTDNDFITKAIESSGYTMQ